MRRSFTYTLLITCVLLASSCKSYYYTITVETKNIPVSDSLNSFDNKVVQTYLPYKKIIEKDMNRVISVSEIEMSKNKPESYLTNFLGDLLLIEGKKVASESGFSFAPAMSYFNYGGIRTYLPKGNITVERIYELMPFENEMVFVELSGSQMKEFLNYIAAKGGDSEGGARFTISNEKAENITIEGKPLQTSKKYWLVTNDYVAGGGDGLEVLTQRSGFVNTGKKIRDIIISYMEEKQAEGKELTAKLDGRITNE
jgi:2',3'-cyclic-nucleotide 2'-phosphodiesterase (5'-nucleotidase family)